MTDSKPDLPSTCKRTLSSTIVHCIEISEYFLFLNHFFNFFNPFLCGLQGSISHGCRTRFKT